MKIIVTGSSGFVGLNLTKKLKELGHFVIGIDRINIKNNSLNEFFQFDLSELNLVKINKFSDVDLLIHCAAAKGDYKLNFDNFYKDNVEATKKLVDFIEKFNINNVIHYSTVSVYGHDNTLFDEEANLNPDNSYGKTKLESEKILINWRNINATNRNLTILRPSVIYGENNFANMYNLLTYLNREYVVFIGDGSHIKSMIAVENMVEITLFVLKNKGFQIYNSTDKPYYSLEQVTNIISEIDGFNKPIINIPLWISYLIAIPFEILSKILNKDLKLSFNRIYKFSKATDYRSKKLDMNGYEQLFSTKERLQNMARWYLKNKKNG
jgi:nucleoside-diphosphate-sugar epimerase